MFSTIDNIFTTTTSFQQTLTILSCHNQISTPNLPQLTSLQELKSLLPSKKRYFLLLHIKFCEKRLSLINKLQP